MAKKKDKKYKYVVLENKELQSQTIGVINNKKNPIAIIIIFIVFIAVVFFLPEITEYIKTKTSKEPEIVDKTPIKSDEIDKSDDIVEEPKRILFADTSVIENEQMIINNFVKKFDLIYEINFDITNILTEGLDLNSYNYYIEFYNDTNTLLDRIKLEDIFIEISQTYSYKKEISSELYFGIHSIEILEIDEDSYPNITLAKNDDGYEYLICTDGIEKNTYFFNETGLFLINKVANVENTIDNYENIYLEYSNMKNDYLNKKGYTYNFANLPKGFLLSISININDVEELINNNYIYTKGTNARIVNFEMISRGYTCS